MDHCPRSVTSAEVAVRREIAAPPRTPAALRLHVHAHEGSHMVANTNTKNAEPRELSPDARRAAAKRSVPAVARRATERAIAALEVEAARHRRETENLERSLVVLRRVSADVGDASCDLAGTTSYTPKRKKAKPAEPCDGAVYARWCRHCGALMRRCTAHGGIHGAVHARTHHVCIP